jgi:hypothetical protein
MNREAVAVASDCTLTVFTDDGEKHLHAVDKVFTLTADPPAVLMVYGRLELADVPWQTLAAEYSRRNTWAPTLADLAREFLDWLRYTRLIRREAMEAAWRGLLQSLLHECFWLSPEDWDRLGQGSRKDRRYFEALGEHLARFGSAPPLEGIPLDAFKEQLRVNDREYDQVLTGIPTHRDALQRIRCLLKLIFALATTRSATGLHASGLAIAGFGRRDPFPAVVEIPSVTFERQDIRFSVPKIISVSAEEPAHLRPYAQTEEVDAFLSGVHPEVADELDVQWRRSETLVRAVERLLRESLGEVGLQQQVIPGPAESSPSLGWVLQRLLEEHEASRRPSFLSEAEGIRGPILDGISHLPRRELGALAENMVSRASWRHRVDKTRNESVGDMVNVAVLSRTAGLEWSRVTQSHRTHVSPV